MFLLRVLLFVASVFVAHGFTEGAGVTVVMADLANIDATQMPNTKNQDPGTFVADVVGGDTNYASGVTKTVQISGGNMAGILGYFGDDQNDKHGYFHYTGDVLRTEWQVYTGNQAFTHSATSTYGTTRTELEIDWSLDIWKVAPAVTGAVDPTAGFTFSGTPAYTGTVYWVVQSAGAAAPSVAQVKAGHSSNDEDAMASGNSVMTAGNQLSVTVPALENNGAYKLYVVGEASTPTVYFYYYILEGTRGVAGNEFYRNVPSDAEILTLTPATDPLNTPVATLPFGAAAALRPVFWMACGLMAILARLL